MILYITVSYKNVSIPLVTDRLKFINVKDETERKRGNWKVAL